MEQEARRTKLSETARLVAEDMLTDEQIAAQMGIGRTTLHRWKQTTGFQALVDKHLEAQHAAVVAVGIANKRQRVNALNDRWRRMKRVIAERAADPYLTTVAGGATGLIVRQLKGVGQGKDFQLVEEFGLDATLLREMRAHEEQAAKEMGQWVEKQQTQQNGDTTVRYVVEYTNDWRTAGAGEIADAPPGATDHS